MCVHILTLSRTPSAHELAHGLHANTLCDHQTRWAWIFNSGYSIVVPLTRMRVASFRNTNARLLFTHYTQTHTNNNEIFFQRVCFGCRYWHRRRRCYPPTVVVHWRSQLAFIVPERVHIVRIVCVCGFCVVSTCKRAWHDLWTEGLYRECEFHFALLDILGTKRLDALT